MKIESGKRNEAETIMVYGQEGVGKSTLFSTEPAIYADCENGTTRLSVDRVACTSYQDVRDMLNYLTRDKTHFYQWFVLDTWTSFERLLVDHVCAENNWKNLESPSYGKGFKVLYEEAESFVKKLKAFSKKTGMSVAILAHAHSTRFDDPLEGTSYDRYEVAARATGKTNIAEMLKKEMAMVGFLHYERQIVTDEDDKARSSAPKKTSTVLMGTRNCAAYDAKNRHGMPSLIEIPEIAPFDAIRQYLAPPPDAVEEEDESDSIDQPVDVDGIDEERATAEPVQRTAAELKQSFIGLAKASFPNTWADECRAVLDGRKFNNLNIIEQEDAVEEMRNRCVDAANAKNK